MAKRVIDLNDYERNEEMNVENEKKQLLNILDDLRVNIISNLKEKSIFNYIRKISALKSKIRKVDDLDVLNVITEEVIDLQEELFSLNVNVFGNSLERLVLSIIYLIISAGLFLGIFLLFSYDLATLSIYSLTFVFFIGGLASRWLFVSIRGLKDRENSLTLNALLNLTSNMSQGIIVLLFVLIFSNLISLPENSSTVLLSSYTIGYSYELSSVLIDALISRGVDVLNVLFNKQ